MNDPVFSYYRLRFSTKEELLTEALHHLDEESLYEVLFVSAESLAERNIISSDKLMAELRSIFAVVGKDFISGIVVLVKMNKRDKKRIIVRAREWNITSDQVTYRK